MYVCMYVCRAVWTRIDSPVGCQKGLGVAGGCVIMLSVSMLREFRWPIGCHLSSYPRQIFYTGSTDTWKLSPLVLDDGFGSHVTILSQQPSTHDVQPQLPKPQHNTALAFLVGPPESVEQKVQRRRTSYRAQTPCRASRERRLYSAQTRGTRLSAKDLSRAGD